MTEIYLSQFPPSQNRIWRSNRGRVHKSDKYENWLVASGYEVIQQRPENISGPYKMTVALRRPTTKKGKISKVKRDIDNFAFKAVSDLLKTVGVVDDDCHAEMISARWVTSGPAVTIRVERAGVE